MPTAVERLGADERAAARGVTIAFLDSGFYPHPDLTFPENRILAFHDPSAPDRVLTAERPPEPSDWHGTQTSVVAAGNGRLCGGLYHGLASEARLVLIKVGEGGKITEEAIARGLEWVLANRERYDIRVVNISLGGDEDAPLPDNRINRLAERAVADGMVVVVAAGNSGCSAKPQPLPPATAPSVITVGGYQDAGAVRGDLALYCSSFGFSADGNVKPEILAPASGVAAPILPGTREFRRAEALSRLASAPDYLVRSLLREVGGESVDLPGFDGVPPDAIRYWVEQTLRSEKIVAAHYQHVDGTSFAAPLVSSVVAQMLEASAMLTPAAVKHLLITTATRLEGAPALRQGCGILRARAAVHAARSERHAPLESPFRPPRIEEGKLVFEYHDDAAERVSVVGDFNDWQPSRTPFLREKTGTWRAAIEPPSPGRYRYKLLVDGTRWVEDPSNGLKEPDPYGAFNSLLMV